MASIHNLIKENSSSISAIFSTIAVVGGAVLYVQNNFADAADLKGLVQSQQLIVEGQQQQNKIQMQQQRQMTMFQLEYYEDKLKRLQEEKRMAMEREKSKVQSRAIYRTPDEIQEDIDDIKKRRDIARKYLGE